MDRKIKRLNFLPIFTLCFCLGIYLVKSWYIPFLVLYGIAWFLVIFSFAFLNKENSVWLLLILGIFLGSLFLKNSYILARNHISKFSHWKGVEPLILKGEAEGCPPDTSRNTTFILKAKELIRENKVYPVTGKVWVKVFRKEKISYGQRVILKGKLTRPYGRMGSRFSYREYLKRQGIYSIFIVSKDTAIKYLDNPKVNPLMNIAYGIRKKSQNILLKYLPLTQAAIFSAMILGERSQILPHLNRLFIQTGTIHILAISGLHVGIVGFILSLLLKALGLKRRIRYLVIIPALLFYCLLTGGRASVIRASTMAIILLVGFFLKRKVSISYSLSLSALIILIINPHQLFDIGFQLSFLSVISIVYLYPIIKNLFLKFKPIFNTQGKIYNRLPLGIFFEQLLKFLLNAFSVSLSAWLGLLLFILYYFKILSPVTILANIVVVPYISLVIALGLTLLVVSSVIPALGSIFASPANLSIVLLIQIIQFFSRLPFAYFYLP